MHIIPTAELTPAGLHYDLGPFSLDIVELCSGIEIQGEKEEVLKACAKVRRDHPNEVFVRPIESSRGDDALFRGYLQLDHEYRSLGLFDPAFKDQKAGPISPPSDAVAVLYETGSFRKKSLLPGEMAAKHPLQETFWVCRDKGTGKIVCAKGTYSQTVAEAKRKGYEHFVPGQQPDVGQNKGELVTYKFGRCWFARLAFSREVDVLLLLYDSDQVWVRCPVWEICEPRWWEASCPYGRIEEGAIGINQAGKFLRWAPNRLDYFELLLAGRNRGPDHL